MRIEVETVVWVDNEEFSSSRNVIDTKASAWNEVFDRAAEDLKIARERVTLYHTGQNRGAKVEWDGATGLRLCAPNRTALLDDGPTGVLK